MLDDIWQVARHSTQTELRNLLGCFLFSADDVFKRLGVLSGGERNRYALARMLLQPSNFLLLDEPTNHLDLRAKDVLLEALEKFKGTVVFVSHDRYFIDKLATRVFEIGGGEVHVFPGNYEDYLWRKQNRGEIPATMPEAAATRPSGNGNSAESVSQPKPKKPKINPYKLREMEDRRKELELEISRAEKDISECEQGVLTFVSAEETVRLTTRLEERRCELVEMLKEWEQVSQALESVN